MSRGYWCGFVAASVFLRNLELEQGGGRFFKLGIELERITTILLEGEVGSFSSWDPSPQMIHIKSPNRNIDKSIIYPLLWTCIVLHIAEPEENKDAKGALERTEFLHGLFHQRL